MVGTRRFSLAGLAIAALALGLALAPPAHAFDRGYLSVGIFSSGPVKGLTILRKTGNHTARGTVSLSGLGDGASATVAWVKKPCSQTVASPAAASQEVAIETIEIAHEGLSFVTRPIALKGTMGQIHSVRIWDGQGRPFACRPYLNGSDDVTASAVFTGHVHGALAALQRKGAGRGVMYTALPDLDAGSSYRVVGSTRPCSRAYTPASRVFASSLPAATNSFVFHTIEFVGLRNTRRVKSVRVFSRVPDGPFVQEACSAYSIELEDVLIS